MRLLQHWCSGFESALSQVLNSNRETEASSLLQLQSEIQSRDESLAVLSRELEQLRCTNADITSQLSVMVERQERAACAAAAQLQQATSVAEEAEARCAALEGKMEEQTKRHEEYAGFIAEVGRTRRQLHIVGAHCVCMLCVTQGAAGVLCEGRAHTRPRGGKGAPHTFCTRLCTASALTRAHQVAHCSALADLRSSTASLACTMEAVARVLAPMAPGKPPAPFTPFTRVLPHVTRVLFAARHMCGIS